MLIPSSLQLCLSRTSLLFALSAGASSCTSTSSEPENPKPGTPQKPPTLPPTSKLSPTDNSHDKLQPTDQTAFVTVKNAQFYVGSQRFRFIGGNFPDGLTMASYGAEWGSGLKDPNNPFSKFIRDTLELHKTMGMRVVRIFANPFYEALRFAELMREKGYPRTDAEQVNYHLEALDYLVHASKEAGLRSVIIVQNPWPDAEDRKKIKIPLKGEQHIFALRQCQSRSRRCKLLRVLHQRLYKNRLQELRRTSAQACQPLDRRCLPRRTRDHGLGAHH